MATFHFFTLLTRDDQYAAMRASLTEVGFDAVSLYTVLDNRGGNHHEPYSAITRAVREAQAPYVVFCHQDLVFYHGPEALLETIRAVEAKDPACAVMGNAGCTADFASIARIDHKDGPSDFGEAPGRVLTLDEDFLVVRRDSGLGCSPELSGFHLYATDLCLNAYQRGFTAWVLDYRLRHEGSTLDYAGLYRLAIPFADVWKRRIGGAVLLAPASVIVLSRIPGLYALLVRFGIPPRLLWRPPLMRALNRALRPWRPKWLPLA